MLSPPVANLENGVSYLAVAVVLAGTLTMAPVVSAQDIALGFPMFRV
jgi:aminoglycoside/choline kinase family phosphotransferase